MRELEGDREAGSSLARQTKQYEFLLEEKEAELKMSREQLMEQSGLVDRL